VDRLATKTIEVGGGEAVLHLGTYEELLWRRAQREAAARPDAREPGARPVRAASQAAPKPGGDAARKKQHARPDADPRQERDARKRAAAESKRAERQRQALEARIASLEAKIAAREEAIKEIEASMATPGFYNDREAANAVITRHQALMWEVGDLMHQWEELQTAAQNG
jgi:uncharacterized coiled-coil protein SlyX